MNVVITGATGFVGGAIAGQLSQQENTHVSVAVRKKTTKFPQHLQQIVIGDLLVTTDYSKAVSNIDVVIHTAARVHVMNETVTDSLTEYRKVNVEGTLELARQAAKAGVKRFIFISSIKVNGEMTLIEQPFKPDDKFIPTDSYGLSKFEAEQGLLTLAKETGMEVVIIRPPLVYGPGVRANFSSMMKWLNRQIPLPLGSIHNKRSLVALGNLVNFIIHCIEHPKAANEVFLVSDNEDVSTTELLQKVAAAFGKRSILLPIPVGAMRFLAKLVGKEDVAERLFSSLQVDSSKARDLLDWKPVITMDEQLKKTADAYINEKTI